MAADPKISRRVAVEARFSSVEEALAFVHEQLTALALPEPMVSITPMVTEGSAFRRVHFIAVVKGTEPTPPTPRCEASIYFAVALVAAEMARLLELYADGADSFETKTEAAEAIDSFRSLRRSALAELIANPDRSDRRNPS